MSWQESKVTAFYDVIVVGAGISGLVAANKLLADSPDLKVIVLEAKDRIGGRTFTTELKTPDGSDNFDLGGQWVSDSQPDIMKLLLELGLETYPQYETGTKLLQLNDGEIRPYSSFIPNVSWLSLIDIRWFIFKFERLAKEIDVNAPYDHPRAEELDSTSMETYKRKHLYTDTAKHLIDISIRTALGCEACDISVLFLLTYAKAAGGLMKLLEVTNGGAQEKRVKGGCLQISERLVEKIGMENIRLSSPVEAIYQVFKLDDHPKHHVRVVTDTKECFGARYVVMAIPLHLAATIKFEPALPERKMLLIKNMPIGHMTKYIITYVTAFWRKKGFSGEIVSTGGPKIVSGCDNGPLSVVYDATTSKGNPALVGFLSGNQGIQWKSKTAVMRRTAILEALIKCFGDEASEPLDFVEKDWSDELYNGGCPVNLGAPGTMIYINEELRKPFYKIHWAGTETATIWRGYMNGAVQSGTRAANEICNYPNPRERFHTMVGTEEGIIDKSKAKRNWSLYRCLTNGHFYLIAIAFVIYIFVYYLCLIQFNIF